VVSLVPRSPPATGFDAFGIAMTAASTERGVGLCAASIDEAWIDEASIDEASGSVLRGRFIFLRCF
jgi:hypothetical protein